MKTIVYAVCILTLVSSCVSKNKFTIAENGRLAALSRERALEKDLARSQEDNVRLQKQISNLKTQHVWENPSKSTVSRFTPIFLHKKN